MNYDSQLKVQAYLDGELPEVEAREIANLLARDREAVALMGELRNTRQALVGSEIGITLPESREFFWSKIEREILRQERQQDAPIRQRPASFLTAWRRFLIPAGALSALALAAFISLNNHSSVSTVETAIADPGAFTYHDFSTGTTLVWFSYPAEDNDEMVQ
jgi:anti-sigma factor RsiW